MRMHAVYLTSMTKYYLEGILIVEGKSDVSYLSSFINALYFTTGGYDISEEKINFLSRVAKINKLYVMTDNDEAGEKIAERIKSKINGIFEIKTARKFKNFSKKFGVAETTKEEIVRALGKNLVKDEGQFTHINYGLNKIVSLSSEPNEIKNRIINDYRLISGNIKFLENQLQMLKISKEEIISKYGN